MTHRRQFQATGEIIEQGLQQCQRLLLLSLADPQFSQLCGISNTVQLCALLSRKLQTLLEFLLCLDSIPVYQTGLSLQQV